MDKQFEIYGVYDGMELYAVGIVYAYWKDESFAHAFGTESRGCWVVNDFIVDETGWVDEDGGDHQLDWDQLDAGTKEFLRNKIMTLEV